MTGFDNHSHLLRTLQRYLETFFIPEESRYGGSTVRVRSAHVSRTTGGPSGPPTVNFEGIVCSPRGLNMILEGDVLEEDLLKWAREMVSQTCEAAWMRLGYAEPKYCCNGSYKHFQEGWHAARGERFGGPDT